MKPYLICSFVFLLAVCCNTEPSLITTYKSIEPSYSTLSLQPSNDSVILSLDTAIFDIRSTNIFEDNDRNYLSLYDKFQEKLLFFELPTGKKILELFLPTLLKTRKMYKTSVYTLNFDSILITNNNSVYIFNKSGKQKDSVPYPDKPYKALYLFDNTTPPLFNRGALYVHARPRLVNTDKSHLRKWRVLDEINFASRAQQYRYPLPTTYQTNLYSYLYFYPYYCINNDHRFVFSFAADSNIYESDALTYNVAYNGKSQYETGIPGVEKENISTGEGISSTYILNDSYGGIFFDPNTQRYIRIFQQKVDRQNYMARRWGKRKYYILFDKNFRKIAEHPLDTTLLSESVLITKQGDIYARRKRSQPRSICFVKLQYTTKDSTTVLAQK